MHFLLLKQIFDALNLASKSMIPAHTGQLAAIQFNPSGTRIATASDKGTVIRVFNVADSSRVYELRRYVLLITAAFQFRLVIISSSAAVG